MLKVNPTIHVKLVVLQVNLQTVPHSDVFATQIKKNMNKLKNQLKILSLVITAIILSILPIGKTSSQGFAGEASCDGNYCSYYEYTYGNNISMVCKACCPKWKTARCNGLGGCGCYSN